jgi:4'-phosphopantetheinyl transferase superfamily protein
LLDRIEGNDVRTVVVEDVSRFADAAALAAVSLSDDEQARLAELGVPERWRAVLRIWTRKEALLKAANSGLACDPRRLTLPRRFPRACTIAGRDWTLTDIPSAGHGSLASRINMSTLLVAPRCGELFEMIVVINLIHVPRRGEALPHGEAEACQWCEYGRNIRDAISRDFAAAKHAEHYISVTVTRITFPRSRAVYNETSYSRRHFEGIAMRKDFIMREPRHRTVSQGALRDRLKPARHFFRRLDIHRHNATIIEHRPAALLEREFQRAVTQTHITVTG